MSKVLAINRRRTVGATLDLYDGYAEAEHEMLEKRVLKQIELESAKKTYEKAKPQKKQQVSLCVQLLDIFLETGNRQRLYISSLSRLPRFWLKIADSSIGHNGLAR